SVSGSRAADRHGIAVEADGQTLERVAHARTLDASAAGRLEDRAVRRADEIAAVLGQEFVRPQIQRRADVRTPIDVGGISVLVMHDEAVERASATRQTEFLSRSRRQIDGENAP